MIPLFTSNVSYDATVRALQTLDSGFLSEGSQVYQFEHALEETLGKRRNSFVAVNSGTSALHLALEACSVGAGDEVIVPPQTFIATALAVLYTGARVVFCDVNKQTGLLDTETVAEFITPRTKAIIPVHWGGAVCDINALRKALGDNDAYIIEDAAQAIGAQGVGKGDLTCYSFQSTKHLTTGDGGAVQDNSGLYYRLRRLRWFGIDRESDLSDELGERQYTLHEIGFKYHMNDVAASIGLGNLPQLEKTLRWHRYVAQFYADNLPVHVVAHRNDLWNANYSWWFFPLLVGPRRLDFARAMKSRNVPVSVVHRRIDRHPIFGKPGGGDLEGMDYFDQHQINLPVHSGITLEDAARFCDEIRKGW